MIALALAFCPAARFFALRSFFTSCSRSATAPGKCQMQESNARCCDKPSALALVACKQGEAPAATHAWCMGEILLDCDGNGTPSSCSGSPLESMTSTPIMDILQVRDATDAAFENTCA